MASAGWLASRLGDCSSNAVTDVVPAGFDAYARILHPAAEAAPGGRRFVRWWEVAAWSGRTMEPTAAFHSIAIPPAPVAAAPPWFGQGPRQGSLAAADAESLSAVVRRHTRTPENCWFCLWDGYDWAGVPLTAERSRPAGGTRGTVERTGPAVPACVRNGPRVELPYRSYFLYRGPVESALVRSGPGRHVQTANLWWPEDRAWCVASEIDLSWTYVGGSVALVRALVGDPALEVVEVAPDSPVAVMEPWLAEFVQPAVETLLEEGRATIVTPVGCVDAGLELPRRLGRGSVRYDARSALGVRSGGTSVLASMRSDQPGLRREIAFHLQQAVIALVGG